MRAGARFRARVKRPRMSTVSISAIEVAMGSDLPHAAAAAMLPRAPTAAPTERVVPAEDVVPNGGVDPTGSPRAAGAHQASRAAVRSAARAAA